MVRIFWIAIAVLAAATAAVFLMPAKDTAAPTLTASAAGENNTRPATPVPAAPSSVPDAQPPSQAAPGTQSEIQSNTEAEPTDAVINKSTAQSNMPQTAAEDPAPEPGRLTSNADANADTEPFNPPSNMPRPDPTIDPATAPPNQPTTDPGKPVTAQAAPIEDQADEPAATAKTEAKPEAVEESAPDSGVSDIATQADQSTDVADTSQASDDSSQATEAIADSESPATEPAPSPAEVVAENSGASAPPAIAVTPRPKTTQPAQPEPAAEPVVKTDTGLLLDGRWKVDGKGTKAAPYKIDWEMLVAVQREYQPRLGQTEIPEWIAVLNGKTVTIRGYALLPMGMSSLSELLVMLNQWDSCCIGVPPTPFDAIEVRLAQNLSNTAQSMFSHTGALSFGDITGTFKVDPYIVQGYLLGLYLMEDAEANLLGPAGTP